LHELAIKALKNLKVEKNVSILDLGSGEGALTLKIIEEGYTNVEVVEYIEGRFEIKDVKCYNLDLNKIDLSLELNKTYDLVIAAEIIEHLENPSFFFRNISQILKPNGHLIITTPNVSSWYSRILFLRHGTLDWFTFDRFFKDGHIHPIFDWQIEFLSKQSGLYVVEKMYSNNLFLKQKRLYRGPLKTFFRMYTYMYLLLIPLMKGIKEGENCLWVIKKSRQ